MITRLRLENFKAHRDTDIALRQLTVLVGENSSGKTSVLEALRLPTQLIEHAAPIDAMKLNELLRRGAERMILSYEGHMWGQPWSTSIELAELKCQPSIRLDGSDASRPRFSQGFEPRSMREYDFEST